ncbi:hypothetical protein OS493_001729 [Desmophyllum pertusum]|uniref:EF-hand domain-containing protein n=1 Tax=Desmophyllum pertusum TaxID=174260 RepID=A0A9W9Z4L0_9CNID|nr:hypothetical protein OS493_001729 [Desmophyllum pertusum]
MTGRDMLNSLRLIDKILPNDSGFQALLPNVLFHAFDRNESGTIDLEEFIGGIALCLHGTVKDKCRLLFHIFNLAEDDGVSRR